MIKSESIIPLLTVCANSENAGCARVGELSIEIINRKAAEIERLKMVIEQIEDDLQPLPFETNFEKAAKRIKSEAIKEFAERLKIKVKMYNSEDVDEGDLIDDLLTVGETVEIIDNLVKEMTEVEEVE